MKNKIQNKSNEIQQKTHPTKTKYSVDLAARFDGLSSF